MLKREIINAVIQKRNYNRYLEVGVEYGYCFLLIKCNHKVAVDPQFKISLYFKLKQYIKYPWNLLNQYHEIQSDAYFKLLEEKRSAKKFDIVLIDGLHTFKQSLLDIINSLNFLREGGTIFVHDCLPPHQAAATPASSIEAARKMNIENWDDLWCGDVWKSIVYLIRVHSNELDVATINEDFGLGVITVKKQIRFKLDETQYDIINQLDFAYLMGNLHSINLINYETFDF